MEKKVKHYVEHVILINAVFYIPNDASDVNIWCYKTLKQ